MGANDTEEPQGIAIDDSLVLSQASDVDLVKRRRKQIVDAAVELFSRQGYYRTTIQQVAKRAGISAGLIYHYARTKEDVLLLALLSVLDTYRAEIPDALKGVTDPLERFRTALSAFCHIVAARLDATVLAYRSTKTLPPPQRALIKQSEIETNEIIADIIRDCIKAKLFRDVDVDLITYQFVMYVHMWALKHWHFKSRFTVDAYIDAGYDSFVHALATPKGLKHYQDITAARRLDAAPPVAATPE